MMKFAHCRGVVTLTILALAALLLLAPASLLPSAASYNWQEQNFDQRFAGRTRHAQLLAGLRSPVASDFRSALAELTAMDEPGVNRLWQAALATLDAARQEETYREYQRRRPELERKEFIPYVARVQASATDIERLARERGVDVDIWFASPAAALPEGTTVAAPRYLLDALQEAGIGYEILYDSLVEFQKAKASGEARALALAAARQSAKPEAPVQVRIAVIDLTQTATPQAGYSAWLGDPENILRRNDSYLAYLDVFASDASPSAISAHLEEQYERRGYRLAGFYTAAEFAATIGAFFPGETFEFSGGNSRDSVQTQGEEGRFHSYEETLAEFTRLAQENPERAALVTLGRSYENRSIFALKISKNAAVNDSTKTDVLITGCHHAREWISVETPVYFAKQLLGKYATDDAVRQLVDRLQIWIVPIVNPDGLAFSQSAPNDQLDGTRLWRKNRRPITTNGCNSGTGVDLNRNYNHQWRLRGDEPCPQTSDDNGASDDPNNEIFRGLEPDSEQEIRAIKSLLDDPARRFRAQLDYHNFQQLILYPYSYQRFAAPDAETLATLAQKMSDEIRKVDTRFYRPQSGYELYTSTGTATDYSYSVAQVAAPFVVEMRPVCCNFNVPENQIDMINQENWAGALVMLQWAAAPPILQSVRAFQKTPDGSFNKLVYSAQWVDESGGRRLEVDTRFPGIEVGPLQLHLQFSKSMDAALNPRVSLGRNSEFNELNAAALNEGDGWRKTVYQNDTWVGTVIIPQDDNETDAWRLAVAATDQMPFRIDGKPQTRADYGVGTNKWQGYEDQNGEGNIGGTDTEHRLSPTLRSGFINLLVASPSGGERLAAGESYTVTWTVPKDTNFIPVHQEIRLSTDSGFSFSLHSTLGGNVENATIILPNLPTTRARLRVFAREGSVGNTIFGDSHADFTIGANVGGGIETTLVSAERIAQNWTDAPADNPNAAVSGALRLAVTLKITNRGTVAIANPFLRLAEISKSNVLLSRDRQSRQSAGAQQSLDAGSDNLLTPGESIEARLVVGAFTQKKFFMSALFYGVPSGGAVAPATPVEIWRGKVKNR